jgi:threonine synthase
VKFVSTRDPSLSATASVALLEGMAPDGGLYVPEALPAADMRSLDGSAPMHELAATLLAPFFTGDPLARSLEAISVEALEVHVPLGTVQGKPAHLSILELFHGPTAAFKDFGARFLAACLARVRREDARPVTVLVATSGDTGGAVASAFHGRPGVRVLLLYPEGRVSAIQERQLTCWGGNVRSLAVQGSFDDCQRLVKQAFADASLRKRHALTSANSINIGRLLPQLVLFASAALRVREARGGFANFVIPSGNLGLGTACAYARAMGLPIDGIVLAHNANRTVPDFFALGEWKPRSSVATLASAMDIGDPSNMERLFALHPDRAELRRKLRAASVDDAEIRDSIRTEFERSGLVLCPHTAAGFAAYRGLPERDRLAGPWVVAATAHPAKFPETVEPLVGRRVDAPPALAHLLQGQTSRNLIRAELAELVAHLESPQG